MSKSNTTSSPEQPEDNPSSTTNQMSNTEQTAGELTTRIVSTVAATAETDALELPPLYDSIDPDALERFIAITDPSQQNEMTFTYVGKEVTVESDGTIAITDQVANSDSDESH